MVSYSYVGIAYAIALVEVSMRCPQYEIVERATGKVIATVRTVSDQRAMQSYFYYHGYREGLFARLAKGEANET